MSLLSAFRTAKLTVGKLRTFLIFGVFAIWKSFDRRDVLVFGGLSLLGYGLHLHSPALSFSVCGGVLTVIGLVGYFQGGSK